MSGSIRFKLVLEEIKVGLVLELLAVGQDNTTKYYHIWDPNRLVHGNEV